MKLCKQSCGRLAHPCYGEFCEDCYVNRMPVKQSKPMRPERLVTVPIIWPQPQPKGQNRASK